MPQIDFRPRARKGLQKAPRAYQERIVEHLETLSASKTEALDLKKLSGTKEGYRLRVGAWRVLFSWHKKNDHVEVVDVFLKTEDTDYTKRIRNLFS